MGFECSTGNPRGPLSLFHGELTPPLLCKFLPDAGSPGVGPEAQRGEQDQLLEFAQVRHAVHNAYTINSYDYIISI